jgi:hypothetical protein
VLWLLVFWLLGSGLVVCWGAAPSGTGAGRVHGAHTIDGAAPQCAWNGATTPSTTPTVVLMLSAASKDRLASTRTSSDSARLHVLVVGILSVSTPRTRVGFHSLSAI